MSSSTSSPPPSPLRIPLTVATALVKFRRARHDALDLSSGLPLTHPSLCGPGACSRGRVPLEHRDRYVCKVAVDVTKLLRGSRTRLLQKATALGANVLVEESWVCHVRIPKNRREGEFRVHIRYCASASRSESPDPQRPVALDKVTNVPGLMTIVARREISP